MAVFSIQSTSLKDFGCFGRLLSTSSLLMRVAGVKQCASDWLSSERSESDNIVLLSLLTVDVAILYIAMTYDLLSLLLCTMLTKAIGKIGRSTTISAYKSGSSKWDSWTLSESLK